MVPKEESFYVTLTATGIGQVQFTARKAGIRYRITKVTVETDAFSSGVATLSRNGQFLTSMPVNRYMEALGFEALHTSEYLTGAIANGPAGATVKWSFFYTEEPDSEPALTLSSGALEFQQQQQIATPVDDPVLLFSTDQTLGNGVGFDSGTLDMRPYNSFHLSIDLSGGTWNDTDLAQIQLFFFDQPDPDIFTPQVFADEYYLYRNASADFPVGIADAVHGGWMWVRVNDYLGSVRSTNMKMSCYGSWRSTPNLWVRPYPAGNFVTSTVLYDKEVAFVAAGATDITNAKMGVGRARVRLESTAGSVNMQINYGSVISTLRDTLSLAAAGITEKEIIMPTRQARVIITNGGVAVNTVRAQIIQERYPQ